MLNVNHRSARGAPNCQQVGNSLLRIGIIPGAPKRIVEPLLHVDEQEGDAGRQRHCLALDKGSSIESVDDNPVAGALDRL
jgi:hypothetical protein